MTFVLALVILVLAVAGAEFVRATCRRQLATPPVARPRLEQVPALSVEDGTAPAQAA